MPVFKESYYEVANTIETIISEFYKDTDDYHGDNQIEFSTSYYENANYKVAVNNCRGNIIRELTFTLIGNQWLFRRFIEFFKENCNKNLDEKDYRFTVQEQSSCVAKINVIYK